MLLILLVSGLPSVARAFEFANYDWYFGSAISLFEKMDINVIPSHLQLEARNHKQDKANNNEQFLDGLSKFRNNLVIPSKASDLYNKLTMAKKNDPISKRAIMRWVPVQCSTIGITVVVEKSLSHYQQIKSKRSDQNAHKATGKKNGMHLVKNSGSNDFYAYKIFDSIEEYTTELGFFMVSPHENIVMPICITKDPRVRDGPDKPGIVFELVDAFSSTSFLDSTKIQPSFMYQMANQLKNVLLHIHRLGYVHGQLNPENILVRFNDNNDLKIVLIGFDHLSSKSEKIQIKNNSPSCTAPEVFDLVQTNAVDNVSMDWWAFGSIVASWFSHNIPECRENSFVKIVSGNNFQFASNQCISAMPDNLKTILYLMSNSEPQLRRFYCTEMQNILDDQTFFNNVSESDVTEYIFIPGIGNQ